MSMLSLLERRLGVSLGCYWVYCLDLLTGALTEPASARGVVLRVVTPEEVSHAPSRAVADQDWYGGPDALGFGAFRDGRLVSVQWIWFGERYRSQRGFWPLRPGEAKSVQLVTAPEERGSGLATALKAYSACELRKRGFTALYSRIWWNNRSSIRVSEKAGWQRVALAALVGHGRAGSGLRLALPLARRGLRCFPLARVPHSAL